MPKRYGPLYDGPQPLQSICEEGRLAADVRGLGRALAAVTPVDRQIDRARTPACRKRKKECPDHAIGRSRGQAEHRDPRCGQSGDGLLITPGQASDKTVFSGPPGLHATTVVIADRGYDSRAIAELVTTWAEPRTSRHKAG